MSLLHAHRPGPSPRQRRAGSIFGRILLILVLASIVLGILILGPDAWEALRDVAGDYLAATIAATVAVGGAVLCDHLFHRNRGIWRKR